MFVFSILLSLGMVAAGPATESYKNQYCTDPRTMRKHAAYTEWADAYSCTRHRCQPGGRNLAIYTVGCKRVEAPESAIECEEVVEDTNMQFPFCCTRLRCLVVVRGEVWTRVLGQPWETLPAAPWSHMYKMKKPPPGDTTFLPKSPGEGPVYELQTELENDQREKVMRTKKSSTKEPADYSEVNPRPNSSPDFVIALSTNADKVIKPKPLPRQHKKVRKAQQIVNQYLDDGTEDRLEPRMRADDNEDNQIVTEKAPQQPQVDIFPHLLKNSEPVREKQPPLHHVPGPWAEVQNSVGERETPMDIEEEITHEDIPTASYEIALCDRKRDNFYVNIAQPPDVHTPEFPDNYNAPKKKERSGNLQALVDAIGTRMRDIESVVQRMSDKVKPPVEDSAEKRSFRRNQKVRAMPLAADPTLHDTTHKAKGSDEKKDKSVKKPNPEGDHYKRFQKHTSSKYIHTTDSTTEQPLFVEDSNLNGYFSDATSTVRRASPPKEPQATYMAPVDNRRKILGLEGSDEGDKKPKKHSHKKKKPKAGHHKKHHAKDDKRKRYKLNSNELDKNNVSFEDDGANST